VYPEGVTAKGSEMQPPGAEKQRERERERERRMETKSGGPGERREGAVMRQQHLADGERRRKGQNRQFRAGCPEWVCVSLCVCVPPGQGSFPLFHSSLPGLESVCLSVPLSSLILTFSLFFIPSASPFVCPSTKGTMC